MKMNTFLATAFLAATPALALAQDRSGIWSDLGEPRPSPAWAERSTPRGDAGVDSELFPGGEADLSAPSLSSKGLGLEFFQAEIAPQLRLSLSFYARLDVPGDTDVTIDHVAYSDIFDVGYGLNVEASLMSHLSPHWSMGGYLSVGWDRFSGASNVDLQTGEFASFDDQDVVTVIVGGKMVQQFGPNLFWEGHMGLGLVHYGGLTYSDVTTPVTISGIQFFRPVNHGLFDMGGRVGFGDRRVTFDIGLDFRFMGSEARGRDVTNVVDPDFFFVFAIDLGVTFRF